MHHLGPTFVLPSILVLLWLLSSPRILSAHCSGVASGSRFSRERITWEQIGCVFNPAEIPSVLKGGAEFSECISLDLPSCFLLCSCSSGCSLRPVFYPLSDSLNSAPSFNTEGISAGLNTQPICSHVIRSLLNRDPLATPLQPHACVRCHKGS